MGAFRPFGFSPPALPGVRGTLRPLLPPCWRTGLREGSEPEPAGASPGLRHPAATPALILHGNSPERLDIRTESLRKETQGL